MKWVLCLLMGTSIGVFCILLIVVLVIGRFVSSEIVAFSSDRGGNFEVYLLDIRHSAVINLTRNPYDDYAAHWSPDGEHLVFMSERLGQTALFIMGLQDKTVTVFVDPPPPS